MGNRFKDLKEFIVGLALIILSFFVLLIESIYARFLFDGCDYCGEKKFWKHMVFDSDLGWIAICKKCEGNDHG